MGEEGKKEGKIGLGREMRRDRGGESCRVTREGIGKDDGENEEGWGRGASRKMTAAMKV